MTRAILALPHWFWNHTWNRECPVRRFLWRVTLCLQCAAILLTFVAVALSVGGLCTW